MDTAKMRQFLKNGYLESEPLMATHFERCEYSHYPCAVIALCDEVDRLSSQLAAAKKAEQTLEYAGYQYKRERDEAQEEAERLKIIITEAASRVTYYDGETYRICCDTYPTVDHDETCPYYRWEGGEQ